MGLSILGYEEHPSDDSSNHQAMEEDEGRHARTSQQIMTLDDDVREDNLHPASSGATPSTNEQRHPDNSILGDMTLFKDFFLAAFSDYNVASCCGGDNFFDDRNPVLSERNSYSSAKLAAPSDHSANSYYHPHHHQQPMTIRSSSLIGRTTSSLSQNSTPAIQNNASHESKRRQRPLAVAVGFKYAEDMNGRPIIITPGNRRMPIRGHRTSPPPSPSSQPTHVSARKDMAPNVLFPVEQDASSKAVPPSLPFNSDPSPQRPASIN